MAPASAKSRRPPRRPAPAADRQRQLLVRCDERGIPVCDDDGRPIFWFADQDGHLRRLDALKDVVYTDDRQVRSIRVIALPLDDAFKVTGPVSQDVQPAPGL